MCIAICIWCLCVYRRFNIMEKEPTTQNEEQEQEQLELFPATDKPDIKVLYEDDGYHD